MWKLNLEWLEKEKKSELCDLGYVGFDRSLSVRVLFSFVWFVIF